jgi:hypothetical protein
VFSANEPSAVWLGVPLRWAQRHTYGRVTLYVALRGHKNEATQAAQIAKITKQAVGQGVVMLIVNLLD